MPRRELLPPNGTVPSFLHVNGIDEPKLPVRAFVFPAEMFLALILAMNGETRLRQHGMPQDARIVGCALANGLPNTIVLFVTSTTWPIVATSQLPEPAALHVEVVAEVDG